MIVLLWFSIGSVLGLLFVRLRPPSQQRAVWPIFVFLTILIGALYYAVLIDTDPPNFGRHAFTAFAMVWFGFALAFAVLGHSSVFKPKVEVVPAPKPVPPLPPEPPQKSAEEKLKELLEKNRRPRT